MLTALLSFTLALPAAFVQAAEDDPAHWPHWRGPDGTGVARSAAPTQFSAEQNVKWVTDIPGRGFSTPIVWGERLFLTSAVATGQAVDLPEPPAEEESEGRGRRGGRERMTLEEQDLLVFCIDRGSGEVLWEKLLDTAKPHEGYHRTYGSYASISPITDGQHVYVSFGSFGLWCLDFEGEVVWHKDLGVKMRTRNAFGEGSGPILAGNTLIQVLDHEGDSVIVALNKHDGKELWRADRDEPTTWAAPLVIEEEGRPRIVVSGTKRVRCYEVDSGHIAWECGGLGLNAIPIPLRHEDTVLVMSGYREANMMSIALGGKGDLTGSDAVVWQNPKGIPYTSNPVLFDGRLYTTTDRGMLSCFDATTGEAHFLEQRIGRGSQLKASPIVAGGKLYIATEAGEVHVLEAGTEFTPVAVNSLQDRFFVSSPIVVEGELFLRSENELFCIAESDN